MNEPETLLRWAGFNEWFGSNGTTRFYFNDPENPNDKMFGYREGREWKWNGGYEGTKKKLFKELNARNRAKMLSAYEAAKDEMMAYIENHKNEFPIFGEGEPGEIRALAEFPELGSYIRMENGKWEKNS